MLARRHTNQQGFSMLELVVVLGIITVMTSVSLSFMGDKDEKHRYQESIVKLKAVQRNFLSVGEYQGKIVASGFLIDNGLLFDDAAAPSLKHSLVALLGTPVDPETWVDLKLLPFAARTVWVNTSDEDASEDDDDDADVDKIKVTGSQLFKGVRPGLFDLSEYRDSAAVKVAKVSGAIKDAWGDDFTQTPGGSSDPDSVTLGVKGKDENDKEITYKALPSVPREFRFSEDEFLLPVSSLSVTLKNIPDTTTSFKVALVSFNNEDKCDASSQSENIVEAGCWHTIKTSDQTVSVNNMFSLTRTGGVPNTVYDDTALSITTISPIPAPSPGEKKLSLLTFTDNDAAGANDWSFTAPIPMQDIVFIFSGDEEISAGSHLLVVLCENTAAAVWEIYLRDTNGCNVVPEPAPIPAPSPVFEYLHLLPGVTPSPIVISLPEPSP
jgi:prepilin-type N-terminal cleavage/methylation domain-containing protein